MNHTRYKNRLHLYSIIRLRELKGNQGDYMKKKAVAYMRCSTDMQDCSVSDQRDAIQKWSKRNKYAIVREYVDDGISGYKAAKRPGFLQMVSDINLQDFEAVLIWDSYRLAVT